MPLQIVFSALSISMPPPLFEWRISKFLSGVIVPRPTRLFDNVSTSLTSWPSIRRFVPPWARIRTSPAPTPAVAVPILSRKSASPILKSPSVLERSQLPPAKDKGASGVSVPIPTLPVSFSISIEMPAVSLLKRRLFESGFTPTNHFSSVSFS